MSSFNADSNDLLQTAVPKLKASGPKAEKLKRKITELAKKRWLRGRLKVTKTTGIEITGDEWFMVEKRLEGDFWEALLEVTDRVRFMNYARAIRKALAKKIAAAKKKNEVEHPTAEIDAELDDGLSSVPVVDQALEAEFDELGGGVSLGGGLGDGPADLEGLDGGVTLDDDEAPRAKAKPVEKPAQSKPAASADGGDDLDALDGMDGLDDLAPGAGDLGDLDGLDAPAAEPARSEPEPEPAAEAPGGDDDLDTIGGGLDDLGDLAPPEDLGDVSALAEEEVAEVEFEDDGAADDDLDAAIGDTFPGISDDAVAAPEEDAIEELDDDLMQIPEDAIEELGDDDLEVIRDADDIADDLADQEVIIDDAADKPTLRQRQAAQKKAEVAAEDVLDDDEIEDLDDEDLDEVKGPDEELNGLDDLVIPDGELEDLDVPAGGLEDLDDLEPPAPEPERPKPKPKPEAASAGKQELAALEGLDAIEMVNQAKPTAKSDKKPAQPAVTTASAESIAAGGGDANEQAAKAMKAYRQTGALDVLKLARQQYKAAYSEAETPFAKALARAGLSEALLLGGHAEKALEQAERALKRFPTEPTATAVYMRASRFGEDVRQRLAGALLRLEHGVIKEDKLAIEKTAAELEQLAPKEPLSGLARICACHVVEDSEHLVRALLETWRVYPGTTEPGDLVLGHQTTMALLRACTKFLEKSEDSDEVEFWTATQDLEDKDNPIPGAIELLLGLSQIALAQTRKLSKGDKQELMGRHALGLYYAQFFDQAKGVFETAIRVDKEGGMLQELKRLEGECGVKKRAFDKPGMKARLGKTEGVGLPHYRKALAARLKLVLDETEARAGGLREEEAKLIENLAVDPLRRKQIVKAAKKADLDDPFEALKPFEESEAPAESKPRSTGFLGRMKAGITQAMDKVKKSVGGSQRRQALRAVAKAIRERPEGGWGLEDVDAFVERTQVLDARLEFLEDEVDRIKAQAARAAGK